MNPYYLPIRLLLATLLLFVAGMATAQTIQFVTRAGSNDNDSGEATATDGVGNVYITGTFRGTATFGSTTLVSAGNEDIFVAKYNASGTVLWARRAGGGGVDEVGYGITADNSGVYLTGRFVGTANFNTPSDFTSNTLVSASANSDDIFVAKYDALGNLLWLRRAGGSGDDVGQGISLDNSGVYITGSFSGTATFDTPSTPASNTLVSAGGIDIFVAKYNDSGTLQWLRRAGGSNDEVGYGIAADNSGVYITGGFLETANFNTPSDPASNTISSVGDAEIFVAKYDASGNVQWARRAGGNLSDVGYRIAVNNSGVYITGSFSGTATFNTPSDPTSNTLASAGDIDIFVAKYNDSGTLQWVRRAGGSSFDIGYGIAVDNSGVYLTGVFGNTANFNTPSNSASNIISAVGFDIFVAKYNAGGNLQWLRRAGGNAVDGGYGIAVDNSGVYVTGRFSETANFNTPSNSNTISSAGGSDVFLSKWSKTIPILTNLAATPATVCAGNTTTFTTTVGNVTTTYDYTLTNGVSATTGTSSSTALSQSWTAGGSGTQSFTLTVSQGGESTTAMASLSVVGAIVYVTQNGAGDQNGSSWSHAFSGTALQEAINTAATCGAQVWVAAGLYKPTSTTLRTVSFQMRDNVSIYGGFVGTETTLTGPTGRTLTSPSSSTLSGDINNDGLPAGNSYHIISNSGLSGPNRLDGFVVTGGNANGNGTNQFIGGGMLNINSNVNIVSTLFVSNTAALGGGMYNENSSVSIVSTLFVSNTATRGGGITSDGGSSTLTSCSLIANRSGREGGAIYTTNDHTIDLSNCLIQSNTATSDGGGIANSSGSSTLTNCSLISNRSGSLGGAIYNTGSYTTALTNCVLQSNTATFNGGGMSNVLGSSTLTSCSLVGNRSGRSGGAIHNSIDHTASLSTCLIQSNTATDGGGGIHNNGGRSNLTSCSIIANQSGGYGGGMYNTSNPITLANCLIQSNTATSGPGFGGGGICNAVGSSTLTSCSLIANWTGNVGGAIYTYSSHTATLNNCLIRSNTAASDGGGIGNEGGNSILTSSSLVANRSGAGGGAIYTGLSSIALSNCLIQSNTATSGLGNNFTAKGPGGGIFSAGGSSTLTSCSLIANQSGSVGEGGAIYTFGSHTATLANCLIQSNTANIGGGIHSRTSGSTLLNTAFVANAAQSQGGAVYADQSGMTLTNASFGSNTAPTGTVFSLTNSSSVSLTNGVVFDNGPVGSVIASGTIQAAYSLFQTGTGGYTSGPGNLTTATSPFVSTTDLRLNACTPAINAGDPATTSATVGTTDLGGQPRFFNSGPVDMGAYEFQSNPGSLTITNPAVNSTPVNQAFSQAFTASGGTSPYSFSLTNGTLPTGLSLAASGVLSGTPTQTGSFTLTVQATDANGCLGANASNPYVLTVSQPPALGNLSASPNPICEGSLVSFTATVGNGANGYSFTLTNGANPLTGTSSQPVFSQSVFASGSGGSGLPGQSYTLTVSNGGAATSVTTTLVVNPLPTVTLAFPEGTTVIGPNTGTATVIVSSFEGLFMQAGTGTRYDLVQILDRINGYEIRRADSNSSGRFPINQGGPYRVTVTGANGCKRTVEGSIVNLP